jgi:hypothetical protein
MTILCGTYMHKGQEGVNVKAHYEFGNDLKKMCFGNKIRMKVDHRIKDIRIVFLSCIL